MSRIPCLALLLLAGGLFLGGTALWESKLHAQEEPKPESAKITTVDGVKLNAQLYRSTKKSLGAVILLHPLGKDVSIKKDEWKHLAEDLHKSGYSVIMFDFRGHGASTSIAHQDEVWKLPPNRMYVKAPPKEKDSIEFKDYQAALGSYAPVLINDIAAVKAYLERQPDCNVGNTFVIGVES